MRNIIGQWGWKTANGNVDNSGTQVIYNLSFNSVVRATASSGHPTTDPTVHVSIHIKSSNGYGFILMIALGNHWIINDTTSGAYWHAIGY